MAEFTQRYLDRHGSGSSRLRWAVRQSSIFAGLDEAAQEDVVAEMQVMMLRGGSKVFGRGDPADSLLLVVSGRVQVVGEAPDGSERVLAELGPGQVVGEMALLTGEPRNATVYAIRDTQVAQLSLDSFVRLLVKRPRQVARSVSSTVIHRLQQAQQKSQDPIWLSTVAVVPVSSGLPVEEFCAQLVAAFERRGSTAWLSAGQVDTAIGRPGMAQADVGGADNAALATWLSEREGQVRFTVYQADAGPSNWTTRCLRQADHVLLVGDVRDATPRDPHPPARGSVHRTRRSLALLGTGDPPAGSTPRWMAAFPDLTGHFHLRLGDTADFDRAARVLAGAAVGLVLGGGGARGFAHIGVIRALREAGVHIDYVGGTGVGALFAAEYALGWDAATMLARTAPIADALLDRTIPMVSLAAGRKFWDKLVGLLGRTQIEELRVPYFAVSTNLTRAAPKVHRTGSLALSVMASNTTPGIYPPVVEDGDLLVDGGVIDNLPVDVMRGLLGGGGTVIGVDVSPPVGFAPLSDYGVGLSGWRVLWSRVNPFMKALQVPSIVDVIRRSTEVGSVVQRQRELAGLVDQYLHPPVDVFSSSDSRSAARIAEAGYAYTRETIATWPPELVPVPAAAEPEEASA